MTQSNKVFHPKINEQKDIATKLYGINGVCIHIRTCDVMVSSPEQEIDKFQLGSLQSLPQVPLGKFFFFYSNKADWAL